LIPFANTSTSIAASHKSLDYALTYTVFNGPLPNPPSHAHTHTPTHTHTHTHTHQGELAELKADLQSEKREKKKEAVKKIIASMTVGKDVR